MSFQTIQNLTDQEGLDTDRINAIISNQQYLYENQLPMQYSAYGETKTESLKIAAGVVQMPSSGHFGTEKTVLFGGFFSTGTRPVVTLAHATKERKQCFIWMDGPGGNGIHPTDRGFRVGIIHYPYVGSMPSSERIHWIAAGY